MERTVILAGKEYSYNLERKRVRNINLRITREKGICVSAPRFVPLYEIEQFVYSNEAYILDALANLPPAPTFEDLDTVRFLGKKYQLRVLEGKHNGVHVFSEQLVVFKKHDFDAKSVFEKWEREECEKLFPAVVERICEIVGRELPIIKYRKMTSRWGSCSKKDNTIVLNTHLIEESAECIEYVIAHEITHFRVFNHSAKFYETLSEIMPDWKERKAKLGK